MPIETFTIYQFEASLPRHKLTGEQLHIPLGLLKGEYCYLIPLSSGAGLLVRSSIGTSGISADCGEDSIRVVIVDPMNPETVLASKSRAYTTRVSGWRDRLVTLLRQEAKRALQCLPCGTCGKMKGVYVAKKGKPGNVGRKFTACKQCKGPYTFQWLEATKVEEIKVGAREMTA